MGGSIWEPREGTRGQRASQGAGLWDVAGKTELSLHAHPEGPCGSLKATP